MVKKEKTVKKNDRVHKTKKEKNKTRTPRERSEMLRTGAFMIPSVLGVLLFFVLPFIVVVYYSIIDSVGDPQFVGFENFARLFRNSAFLTALKNTGTFSLIAVPAVVVISLLLAVLLDAKVPYKSAFRTIFLSPMIVPAASVILIWQMLFDYHGVINDITAKFGAAPIEWMKSDVGITVVVLLFLWKNIGYNMIMFMSALSSVPNDLLEVAMLDGCNPVQRFFKIKLRYLASSVSFVTIMSLINSFKVFREVYLLTGDHPYGSMYTLQHFMNNTFSDADYQKLSSAAIILCLIMIVIISILIWVDNKAGKEIEE